MGNSPPKIFTIRLIVPRFQTTHSFFIMEDIYNWRVFNILFIKKKFPSFLYYKIKFTHKDNSGNLFSYWMIDIRKFIKHFLQSRIKMHKLSFYFLNKHNNSICL